MGKGTRILRDNTKVLPGEMGEPERREHRTKEATNMLCVLNQLSIRRSHEKPRKERPQRAQTGKNKGGKEQKFRRGHRDDLPDMQEELYEPKDDEAAYENGAWGNSGVTSMQRMREKNPNQVDTAGTPKNKLRRREKLEGDERRRQRYCFLARGN